MIPIGLAKKTRVRFERALELDPDSIEALDALIEWHIRAPAFIGGSATEQNKLERRLKALEPDADKRAHGSREPFVSPSRREE